MTETQLANGADWDAQFKVLKARFPKVRDTILFCLHALQQNPSILIDDLRPLAELHRLRVTSASLASARRLLDKQDQPAATSATAAPRARRTRQPEPTDVEALIRSVADRLQRSGDERVGRLRDAIRKAIDALQAALEA